MKVAIYSRTSTRKQSYTRQSEELIAYSNDKGYEVVGVYEEIVSGYKKNQERPELMRLLHDLQSNSINQVLVWEISRLGRTVSQVTQTIELFNELNISLFIKMNNLETLIDGNVNPMTSFMINILTSVAEMEKSITVARMSSGRKEYIKREGKNAKIGRPINSKISKKEMLTKHSDIVKFLRQGQSIRNISKLTDKGVSTVTRVKKLVEA